MTIDGTSAPPVQDRDPGGFVQQRLHGAGIGVGIADGPEDPPSGLLHRSPPIGGTGETRLVLVLDPLFDGKDAG